MTYHFPNHASCPMPKLPETVLFPPTDVLRLERDIRYMRQSYPEQVRRLAELTEWVADRYDTPNSFFYDEFPDRISMLHIAKEISDADRAERLRSADTPDAETVESALDVLPATPSEPLSEEARQSLIELLLLQDILLRREKRRQGRRSFITVHGLGSREW